MKPAELPKAFTLPHTFLLGTATAATQIEGGAPNHAWYRWSELGKISDGASPLVANDHWNRVREDCDLMASLGLHTARFGVEWSRIEPSPGTYDESALSHYRKEIVLLRERGIRPLLTIYHFSNPLWFEDSGGWMRGDSPQIFLGLVEYIVKGLGDIVSDWVTINEPSIYLLHSYIFGVWPPGHQSFREYLRGARHMIQAHSLAYEHIHRIRKEQKWDDGDARTSVGVAHHLRIFDPLRRWNPVARFMCRVLAGFTQGIFLKATTVSKNFGRGAGKGLRADFIGINYYSRDMVAMAWNPAGFFTRQSVREGAPTSNLGWEIYPEGLGRLIRACYKRYRLPIWITENGTADADDAFRSAYILDHLRVISECIEAGIPVQRYYHWTFIDNFEWLEGNRARFGLVSLDFATQQRTIRPSGHLFAKLCATRSWSPE